MNIIKPNEASSLSVFPITQICQYEVTESVKRSILSCQSFTCNPFIKRNDEVLLQ